MGVSKQKPMVTREEYDRARAVLDALPPGYYVKCAGCSKWKTGGTFTNLMGEGPKCEDCRATPKPGPAPTIVGVTSGRRSGKTAFVEEAEKYGPELVYDDYGNIVPRQDPTLGRRVWNNGEVVQD